jgi:hypothetical protein
MVAVYDGVVTVNDLLFPKDLSVLFEDEQPIKQLNRHIMINIFPGIAIVNDGWLHFF